MIINWKGKGILTVPVVEASTGGTIAKGKVGGEKQQVFIPGYSEVADDVWEKIKPHLQDKIQDNRIDEIVREKKEEIEVPTGERDDKGNPILRKTVEKVLTGVPLHKMPPARALEIVHGCFDMKSLKLWEQGDPKRDYEPETRQAILAEILRQQRLILSGGKEEQPSVVVA